MTIARAQMYRQLYQMGGIGTLPMDYGQPLEVPQQMPTNFSSAQNITMNPLLNYGQPQLGQAGGTPLTMASGGIANLVEREKYGIGSKIKKFVRNIIPNEIAEIAVKAAPFVAPFNPLLAGAMAGIGGFDKTGRIGSSLKSAALTYGAGQLGRYVGGAGFQEGINPFAGYNPAGSYGGVGSLFSSPIGTETGLQLGQYTDAGRSAINQIEPYGGSPSTGVLSKTPGTLDQLRTIFDPTSGTDLGTRARAVVDLTGDAIKSMYTIPDGKGGTVIDKKMVIATISGAATYLEAKKKADEAGLSPSEFNEQIYNQEKARFSNTYQANLNPSSFGITPPPVKAMAQGGMMNDDEGILSIKLTPRDGYFLGNLVRDSGMATAIPGGSVSESRGLGRMGLISKLIQQNPEMFRSAQELPSRARLYQVRATDFIDENEDGIDDRTQRANGGRMDYAMGSEIPVRQNQGGVSELDLRAKGGYIPVGIKEKADDVPAMLSKNEFVFTADAVRGAGGGDINKGAQKMYKLMKSLEKKIIKKKVK